MVYHRKPGHDVLSGKLDTKTLYFLSLFLLFSACAKQAPPPGGPADTAPPRVIEHSPAADSTNIQTSVEIEITFSEPMNKKSVVNALRIIPGTAQVTSSWKKNTLTLRVAPALQVNTTYIITLSVLAQDVHNNNLAAPFSFAFSTGTSVDRGSVSGLIIHKALMGKLIHIWAYALGDEPDSNILKAEPHYVTESYQQGAYQLSHMAPGTYRIFALHDKNKDAKFSAGVDEVGIPYRDLRLSEKEPAFTSFNFRLHVQDTIKPDVLSVQAKDIHHLEIVFTTVIDSQHAAEKSRFQLFDSTHATPVMVNTSYRDQSIHNKVHLVTKQQRDKTVYALTIPRITAVESGIASDTIFASFYGSSNPDTVGPSLRSIYPANKAINVEIDGPIKIIFSEAVLPAFMPHITLNDSHGVAYQLTDISWVTPLTAQAYAEPRLPYGTVFKLQITLSDCKDWKGNEGSDSLHTFSFTTVGEDTLGSLFGAVIDKLQEEKGQLVITLTKTSGLAVKKVILPEQGSFSFVNLLPGHYQLTVFKDRNNNGSYDFGYLVPFVPSEPFSRYGKPITIRSQWELEDIRLVLE